MGSVGSRDLSNNGTDTEVLRVTGRGQIFTGAIGYTRIANVAGWTTNPEGYEVCNSGSYSGQVCAVIRDNNTCIRLAGRSGQGYACHEVHAENGNYNIANQEGDSGGPIFRVIGGTNGSLEATGIDSASTPADRVTCQYNTSHSNVCYWDLYYTAMISALQEWHATINTS